MAVFLAFLRNCNQCIKTLHLSYQTSPYNDFHFLAYNGFLHFFRPLVAGVKRKNFILKKYFQFSYGIRHIKTPRPEKVWNSPPPIISGKGLQWVCQMVYLLTYLLLLVKENWVNLLFVGCNIVISHGLPCPTKKVYLLCIFMWVLNVCLDLSILPQWLQG